MNMIGIRKPPAGTWSISRIRRIFGVTLWGGLKGWNKLCDEYKRYLQEYTRKYNRQAEIYGYQKIKEEDAKKHVVVKEMRKYYQEGREGGD